MQTHSCKDEKKPIDNAAVACVLPYGHPSWRRWLLHCCRRPQPLVEHDATRDTRHHPAAVQRPLVCIVALHVPIVERVVHKALYVPRHQLVLVGEVDADSAPRTLRVAVSCCSGPSLPREGVAVRPSGEQGAVFVVAEGGRVLVKPAVAAVGLAATLPGFLVEL